MRGVRLNPILLAAALAFSLASPLCADQVVYFINGKAIMVKSVEKGDKFTVLEMDGGGKMGVPTDQIERIEEYVLSTPAASPAVPQAAPAQVPAVVQAPVPAQPAIRSAGRANGFPANLPPAAPLIPGPGVGGRPSEAPGRGIAGLQPLDLSGAAAPLPGIQRPTPQSNAGPAMGGPGGFKGRTATRPNFNPAGRRFDGRPGMPGRQGRPPDANRYQPPTLAAPAQNQPPAQGQQPVHPQAPPPDPPPPAEEDPPAASEPETESPPPADPENETSEPETTPPAQGETPDDSSGGAS